MRVALFATAALLGVALAVQAYYARSFSAHATRTVRIVWGVNMGLLAVLIVGILAYAVVGVG